MSRRLAVDGAEEGNVISRYRHHVADFRQAGAGERDGPVPFAGVVAVVVRRGCQTLLAWRKPHQLPTLPVNQPAMPRSIRR